MDACQRGFPPYRTGKSPTVCVHILHSILHLNHLAYGDKPQIGLRKRYRK